MPLLVLVPIVLASMPKEIRESQGIKKIEDFKVSGNSTYYLQLVVFLILLIFSFVGATSVISPLTNIEITQHAVGNNLTAAVIDWRLWSTAAVYLVLTCVAWVYARFLTHKEIFLSIKVTNLVIASLFTVFSYTCMSLMINWDIGFSGPPIIMNIFLQSLSAPFKPIIAHVLYFGPVILLATTALSLKKYRVVPIPWALIVLFCAFLPFLSLSSESRQWIAVFPVFVALYAISNQRLSLRWVCFLFGFVLTVPAYKLLHAITIAIEQHKDFMSTDWQYYFGRQGPWMSIDTYLIGGAVTLSFLMILFIDKVKSKKVVR